MEPMRIHKDPSTLDTCLELLSSNRRTWFPDECYTFTYLILLAWN